MNCIEIKDAVHFQFLAEKFQTVDSFQSDFKNGHLSGFFVLDGEFCADSVLGYVLYYFAYSTWQNRVLYISDIWLKDEEKMMPFLIEELKAKARIHKCNRINLNEISKSRLNLLEKLGAINLTETEEWHIFEMSHERILEFNKLDMKLKDASFEFRRVVDINKDAAQIVSLIRELAKFEKMEDQLQITSEDLIRDYSSPTRFYEVLVVFRTEIDETSQKPFERLCGYALYYFNYEKERGLGVYLEDLMISETYRNLGLGTFLWKLMLKDCIEIQKVKFMQWAVLAWNSPAIKFYYKFNSVDLTKSQDLQIMRFVKEDIYSDSKEQQ